MGKYEKLLTRILIGRSDNDIQFSALCDLLKRMGFDMRVRGSHHIFTRFDVAEIINLQPKKNRAKPYQVKQIRSIIVKYKLGDINNV